MSGTIYSSKVAEVLRELYADSERQSKGKRPPRPGEGPRPSSEELYKEHMNHAYMAIGPDLGRLLYALARTSQAKTIVEFGTSFGVSAMYLASALRDNGGGQLISTEFAPNKVETAQKNLEAAGLADLVDIRFGDALETLAQTPDSIDMVFLDGAKELYLPVLQLLEPRLRSGCIIASDNTDHEGMEEFLTYLREPANGYVSSAGCTARHDRGSPHEISVRV